MPVDPAPSPAPSGREEITAVSDQPGVEAAVDIAGLSFDEALPSCSGPSPSWSRAACRWSVRSPCTSAASLSTSAAPGLLGEAELRVQKLLERSSGALEAAEILAADAADQE
jgi:hypothetical protein